MPNQYPLASPATPTKVKDERLRRGWTLAQAAFHSTLTLTEISQIENGRLIPTERQLAKLAMAFKVKPPYSVLLERSECQA